jgi:hypothetical protein
MAKISRKALKGGFWWGGDENKDEEKTQPLPTAVGPRTPEGTPPPQLVSGGRRRKKAKKSKKTKKAKKAKKTKKTKKAKKSKKARKH